VAKDNRGRDKKHKKIMEQAPQGVKGSDDDVCWRQNSVLTDVPMFGLKWKEALVTGAVEQCITRASLLALQSRLMR
jgi:hypothetical protein